MVSVIIPTYGGGEGLQKVIDSILEQTYSDREILVVDDNGRGSENQIKTEKLLQPYLENGSVQYITPEKNAGGSAARNTGARASRGQYLMFLDDDDTVSADKLEKQVAALEAAGSGCGLAYCSTRVYADGQLSNTIPARESGDILYRYMMGKIYIGTGTALLRREAWENLGGYDESFRRHQDWEFFARVLDQYSAVAVPDAYFNRFITNRNLPKKLDVLEQHADHYIAFLQRYPFRLPKGKVRNVINMNNSRIALRCIREKNLGRFARTLAKYDNPFRAYAAFGGFVCTVLADRLTGRKS